MLEIIGFHSTVSIFIDFGNYNLLVLKLKYVSCECKKALIFMQLSAFALISVAAICELCMLKIKDFNVTVSIFIDLTSYNL